jgi:hypothetical protein
MTIDRKSMGPRWTRRQFARLTAAAWGATSLHHASVAASQFAERGIRDITWEMGRPLPRPTKGQAQGVVGESIIFACGPGYPGWIPAQEPRNRGKHNDVFLFNTRTLRYEALPEAPVGIRWPQAAVVGEDFYLLTGWVLWPDPKPDVSSKRMFRLSRRTGDWRWEAMPSLRTGRFIPGVAAAGGTIVVMGGQASFGAPAWGADFPGVEVSAVEAFDTSAPDQGWRDLPPVPGLPRESMAAAAVGRRVYVFGGFYTKYAEARTSEDFDRLMRGCGDAYVLDLETLRWRRLPDAPFPAQGWESAVYQDRYIILAGGVKNYPVEHPYRFRGPDSQDPAAKFRSAGLRYGNRDLPHPSEFHPALSNKGPWHPGEGSQRSHYDRFFQGSLPSLCATESNRQNPLSLRGRGCRPGQRHRRSRGRNHPRNLTGASAFA